MHERVLMMSSLPLAAPWNGADKNLGRLIAQTDRENTYLVQTGMQDAWPAHVIPIRSTKVESVPTPAQKLRSFLYLMRYTMSVDLIHIVASLNAPSPLATAMLASWHAATRKPILHTLPSIGDIPINPRNFIADANVVVSRHSQQKLNEHGIENVFKVYPAVDIDSIKPSETAGEWVKSLALGLHAILYPAHYGPRSGIQEAIIAFSQLPHALKDAVLVLACRSHPWQNPDVEAQQVLCCARELGVADRVRVVGNVKDMPALISACAITALVPAQLVSKMDIPLVILESLALKRPVIVCDRPPMDESLLGGGGFSIPFGDIPAFTQAMQDLLSDPFLHNQLALQGYQAVRQQCHPDQIAIEYREIYRFLQEMKIKRSEGLPSTRSKSNISSK